ncbi:MAG: methylenetetrahydrofolate reductase [NAD(P)H] [Lachnospiraceae bacterium]|nr:methylenetetrahydrofolate reductase [NAD(P)H] [Candidatus Equihabitans merdae]
MRISEILSKDRVTLSFEVFPPKTTDRYESVAAAAEHIAAFAPDFMSVTYGAGGGTSQFTADIAAGIQEKYGVPVLAHLTCVSSDRAKVRETIELYKEKGIENILGLRGDLPKDGKLSTDYRYACELIAEIKSMGDFCVGGACYPEGHPESAHKKEDIMHLREKVDAGCEFLTTQMFFDNNVFYNFLYHVREAGITVPIIPGIMPITNAKQLGRSVALSGTGVPASFKAIVDRFGQTPDAMMQAGVNYAAHQIIDLIANGIRYIHIYTMNKPEVALAIKLAVSKMLEIPNEGKEIW